MTNFNSLKECYSNAQNLFWEKDILKTSILAFGIGFLSSNIAAQNKPFPQEIDFQNCIKPNNVSQAQLNADVASFYETWKSQYLKATDMPGGYYVHGECTGCTEEAKGTSEGHGWGMLITVLMAGYDTNAKTYYDGFYKYFDEHRSPFNDELMSWMVEYSENGGEHTATDGDLDIAYSLLLAHDQWGSNGAINYLQEAKNMITDGLKVSDMNQSSYRVMRGTWDKDPYTTRSSDWMTAQFRAYQEATNDSFWNTAINTSYDLMNTIQNNHSQATGLMPDFIVNANPTPAPAFELESEHDGSYNWNACRFPWRVAMDYAHYGNNDAKAVVNKIVNWAKSETGGNISNFKAGYTLDGSPLVEYTSTAFISPVLVGSIVDASHQSFLNSGWSHIKDSYYSYYDASINLLSMLVISGNWWVPLEAAVVVTTPETELTISSLDEFPEDGGSQTITVTSNDDWSLTENSSWIDVNRTNGSGNGSIIVSCSRNTSTSSRRANITFNAGNVSRSMSISQEAIQENSPATPTVNAVQIPALIEAENYVSQSGVRLESSQDIDNGSSVGWIDQDDYLTYTINVPNTGAYIMNFRVASRNAGVNFDILQGNSVIGNVSSAATGGWYNWDTLSANVNLSSGEQTITLLATQTGWNINWIEFTEEEDETSTGPTEPIITTPTSGCDGIAAWNANTIYAEKGTQVVFDGNIYENKWYTLNQSPADFSLNSWDLWTLLGSCTSSKNLIAENLYDITATPNPFVDTLTVNANESNFTIGSIQLVDMSGKIISKQNASNTQGLLNDLDNIAKGLYLVQVLGTEGIVIAVEKVIKE